MNQRKLKVLLVGNYKGKNRVPAINEILLEDPRDGRYHVMHNSRTLPQTKKTRRSLSLAYLIASVNRAIYSIISSIDFLLKAYWADVIVLLPMCHDEITKISRFIHLKKKKVISELYISAYTTYLDRTPPGKISIRHEKRVKLLDQKILTLSDILIHVSKAEVEHLCHTLGGVELKGKLEIIPLAGPQRKLAEPSSSSVYRICWWGSFIPLHGVDTIIDAASILVETDNNLEITLFGLPSPQVKLYEKSIQDKGLAKNVRLRTQETFNNGRLEEILSVECDLALGSFGRSEKAGIVLVNKVIDAIAMRLPVLTCESKAVSEFFDTDSDLFVCKSTPQSLADSISSIRKDPEESRQRALNGNIKWRKLFRKHAMIKKYRDIFEGLHDNLSEVT